MKTPIAYTLCLLLVSSLSVQGQILGRIMDRAMDKAVNQVEDRLVEAAAEAVARQMYKPIDKALDSMMYRQYRSSSFADSTDYSGFLQALSQPVDLPPSYTFDMALDIETESDGDKANMRMLFKDGGSYFGFEQVDEEGSPTMIMDVDAGLILMYQTDGDDKTVMAIPNMMGWVSAGAQMADPVKSDFVIEKTGKTKKILGYQCDEYRFETDEDKGTCYATTELPVSWKDAFSGYMAQLQSERYAQSASAIEGMLLESESQSKKKKKKGSSTWETVRVDLSPLTYVNADYRQVTAAEMDND